MKEIKLSRGFFARVSDEDFDRVNAFKWTHHRGSYSGERDYAVRYPTVTKKKRVWIRMHRFIMGLEAGDPRVVDHLDGDGLNNQRENLEVISFDENLKRAWVKRKAKVKEPYL